MNLESIMYAKWRGQAQKTICYVISVSGEGKTRNQISGCQGCRWGERVDSREAEGKFWGDKNVLYFCCGGSYTSRYICQGAANFIKSEYYLNKL